MASIREIKNKDGSVSYQISVLLSSMTIDGKRKSVRKTKTVKIKEKAPTKIKKELAAIAADFERDVKEGTDFSDGNKITFDYLVNVWMENVVSVRVSTGSITAGCKDDYSKQIRLYASPCIGSIYIGKIRPKHIDDLVKRMLDKGLSNKTVRNAFNCIRQVFDYAVKNDLIVSNPCDRASTIPKVKKDRVLHTFDGDQTQRFLNEALLIDIPRSDAWKKQEDIIYFNLALYGGFRKGELCALQWNDIDLDKHTIDINKAIAYTHSGEIVKQPKTASGFRKIMLPASCFALLRSWKQTCKEICIKAGNKWHGFRGSDFDENYVFIRADGSRISNREPYKRFKLIIRAYNETVPDKMKLPDIRLHDLRHTCASHLVAAGTDIETVARRLGHSNPSFTLDIYAHALEEKDQQAADTLESIFASR